MLVFVMMLVTLFFSAAQGHADVAPGNTYIIIKGSPSNPYWQAYKHGAHRACHLNNLSCRFIFVNCKQLMQNAEFLQRAMNSHPHAIAIHVPNRYQLTTLLRQANANKAPLVISSSGMHTYRELDLDNYVGTSMQKVRALLQNRIQNVDGNHPVIISRYNIDDRDHQEFINSITNSQYTQVVKSESLEETIAKSPEGTHVITFGHKSATIAASCKKNSKNKWKGQWIAIAGGQGSASADLRIDTQPYAVGFETIQTITSLTTKRSHHRNTEVLVSPKLV